MAQGKQILGYIHIVTIRIGTYLYIKPRWNEPVRDAALRHWATYIPT